jgi:anaerobic dimethyl sulfoxide reductase subunit A
MTADIVLPMTDTMEDNVGFHPAQNGWIYADKLVEPVGEAKSRELILIQLAEKLGVVDLFMPGYTTEAEFPTFRENAMKRGYENVVASDAFKNVKPDGMPTFEEFKKKPTMRVDCDVPAYALSSFVDQGTPLTTPSGKIEFFNKFLDETDTSKIHFGYTEDAFGIIKISPMGVYHVQKEGFFDPNFTEYPIVMNDTHQRYRFFSAQDSNPMLTSDVMRRAVWINVSLAKSLGVKDNDLVRVYNDRGEMVVPAYVTSRIVPGEAYIFDGGWFTPNAAGIDRRGAANTLSPDGHVPDQIIHNYRVKVEKF